MTSRPTGADSAASRSAPFRIGLATFGILALELALIRWTSSQIRIFAYFNNLVLIGAFLGMGLGVAVGPRHPGLMQWTLPALCLLSAPLAFSESLGLVSLPFPDRSVYLWQADQWPASALQFLQTLSIFLLLFAWIVAVFLLAGSAVGSLFARVAPLRGYSADLLGSLLGILAFTAATFCNAAPPIWLLIAGLPFLALSPRLLSAISLALIVALARYSQGSAVYSAYNRIDIERRADATVLSVNRDFHQLIHDFSDRRIAELAGDPESQQKRQYLRAVYDIPFSLGKQRERALIVGAGTGNDVQAALRNGYRRIWSVDIDGRIIELGRRLHPEHPYDDPRVTAVVDDARGFFGRYDGEPFDVVCYGLLDSHAMFSSMSTLRLDNYVYTTEGIRAAWKNVAPEGCLSISFSVMAGPWLLDRLYWTITCATAQEPLVLMHGMHAGATFLVLRDPAPRHVALRGDFGRGGPSGPLASTRVTSDDWPFLYVRPDVFPLGYVVVLTAVALMTCISVPMAFGGRALTRQFDPVLCLMGAGFLLIEARGVTSLSLLFGSTWIVNSVIFAALLTVVWMGALGVRRLRLIRPAPWFVLLLLAVGVLWAFPLASLTRFSLPMRGLLGGLLNALPIACAGLIVPILLARSANPSAALGSNLVGSVLGGCVEYLSMAIGLQALVAIALLFYAAAFSLLIWSSRGRVVAPAAIPRRHPARSAR